MKYVTIASTFSGNKGAASMLEASIQTITKLDKEADFSVFTIYPEQDQRFNNYSNVRIFGAKPLYLGLVINPLSLIYRILPPARPLLRKQKHIGAITRADVFLDQGGITFVDGRTKFLIYNLATILPAIFIGTPVVKCSQAMGPFTGLNKFIASLVLPRIETICARGSQTFKHLKTLSLNNVVESTDYAFLMDISKDEVLRAKQVSKTYNLNSKNKTIVLMPSEVVRKKTENSGDDYVKFNVSLIEHLTSKGYKVVLMAYSARENTTARHNNDLEVCKSIASEISDKKFIFINEELSAQVLRHIIGMSTAVVTSRFHAMIASLTMGVPPLVIGWSHKYEEIMKEFDMSGAALDSSKLNENDFIKVFDEFEKNNRKYRRLIKTNLPKMKKSANVQVQKIINR